MIEHEIRNGHVRQREAVPDAVLHHEFTFLPDVARAMAQMDEDRSCLVAGVSALEAKPFLSDVRYSAKVHYSMSPILLDCGIGEPTIDNVREGFSRINTVPSDPHRLVVVNNIDSLIGATNERPTQAQKYAIEALTDLVASSRNLNGVLGIITWPERARGGGRAEMLGAFASKHSFTGAIDPKKAAAMLIARGYTEDQASLVVREHEEVHGRLTYRGINRELTNDDVTGMLDKLKAPRPAVKPATRTVRV